MRGRRYVAALAVAAGACVPATADAATVTKDGGGTLIVTGDPGDGQTTFTTSASGPGLPGQNVHVTLSGASADTFGADPAPAGCTYNAPAPNNTSIECSIFTTGSITINGGDGPDTIVLAIPSYGETGNGGDGPDTDVLSGTDSNDVLNGGTGNDSLSSAGSATLNGDLGNDSLSTTGDAALNGGDGTDTLSSDVAGPVGGPDLDGGAGDDTITAANQVDEASGGPGNDTITHTGASAGTFGATLDGDDGNDTITGGAGSQVLNGGTGADVLSGGPGDDQVVAGAFAIVDPTTDADTVDGGPGRDLLLPDRGADVVRGGEGSDTALVLYRSGPTTFESVQASLDGVANDGPVGASTGNIHPDVEALVAAEGNDTLIGSSGADELAGGGGSDTLVGGAGVDVLRAGSSPALPIGKLDPGTDTIDSLDGESDAVFCDSSADSVTGDTIDDLAECGSANLTNPFPIPPAPAAQQIAEQVDRTPATLRVGTAASRRFKAWTRQALAGRKGVTYPVSTNEPATILCEVLAAPRGASVARTGDLVIGEGKAVRGTGLRNVKLTLGKKYRRQASRLASVRIRVTATDAAGNVTQVTGTVKAAKAAKKGKK